MKYIAGTSLISNPDGDTFSRDLAKAIENMQSLNQEIEIQYQPAMNEKQVMFSAMLIGRKEVS